MISQLTFALLFLPDLPSAIILVPAILMIALAVSITFFKSPKGTAFVKTPLARISLVVLAQIVVLGAFQSKYQAVVDAGQVVVLEARPADPFDFFRGFYQSLKYDINDLKQKSTPFHFATKLHEGDVVYVALRKNGNVWEASDVFDQKPNISMAPFIKGQLVHDPWGRGLQVHFGIEQYFYPDSKPISIPNGALVSIKVDANGDAVVTDLVAKEKEEPRESSNRNFRDRHNENSTRVFSKSPTENSQP